MLECAGFAKARISEDLLGILATRQGYLFILSVLSKSERNQHCLTEWSHGQALIGTIFQVNHWESLVLVRSPTDQVLLK